MGRRSQKSASRKRPATASKVVASGPLVKRPAAASNVVASEPLVKKPAVYSTAATIPKQRQRPAAASNAVASGPLAKKPAVHVTAATIPKRQLAEQDEGARRLMKRPSDRKLSMNKASRSARDRCIFKMLAEQQRERLLLLDERAHLVEQMRADRGQHRLDMRHMEEDRRVAQDRDRKDRLVLEEQRRQDREHDRCERERLHQRHREERQKWYESGLRLSRSGRRLDVDTTVTTGTQQRDVEIAESVAESQDKDASVRRGGLSPIQPRRLFEGELQDRPEDEAHPGDDMLSFVLAGNAKGAVFAKGKKRKRGLD